MFIEPVCHLEDLAWVSVAVVLSPHCSVNNTPPFLRILVWTPSAAQQPETAYLVDAGRYSIAHIAPNCGY